MKKVNVKKEILIVLFITLAIIAVSTTVLATGADGVLSIPSISTQTTATDTNTAEEPSTQQISIIPETPQNTTTNTATVTPTTPQNTTNTTGSTYQNTSSSLPQTGDASDYVIFALIAVAVIVAGYAYKKVKDYNI